jgi:sugar-specific transcriptional regulator TrmB
MSQEKVFKTLYGLGLTRIETQIYIHLAKKGPLKGNEIAKNLKVTKQQLYPSLRNLQRKGIVNATLEHPARFSTISFEKVVDLFVKSKLEEAQCIEENKKELFDSWQSIAAAENKDLSAKFTVITGRGYIYSKIFQMIQEADTSISIASSVHDLVRADQIGIFDSVSNSVAKNKIKFRFLTYFSQSNFLLMEKILGEMRKTQTNFEVRSPGFGSDSLSTMVIKDHEEAVFFITPEVGSKSEMVNESSLWTNSKSLVDAFYDYFEQLWSKSKEVQGKKEVTSGAYIPEEKTGEIGNPEIGGVCLLSVILRKN